MKNRITSTAPIKRQGKKLKICAGCGVFCLSLLLLNLTTNSEAIIVTIDPGDVGTNASYIQDFSVLDGLNGTVLNGQTQSVDVFFTNNKFLVAAGFNGFTIDLFINQDGPIGAWPTNTFAVTGYLMDAAGNALGTSVSFQSFGSMPAQFWPNWPFYLPGGTQYLPATKMLESKFFGSHIYGNPNGYYINPITFSGVHFDITYPNSPANTVMGGRIVIACFDGSIFISPNPAPQYTQYLVYIPKPRLTLTGPGPPGGSNSNIFSLRLAGTRNYPYILLCATNLTYPINWQPFITNSTDTNGSWNITITNMRNVPSEYFQAVSWPWVVQQ